MKNILELLDRRPSGYRIPKWDHPKPGEKIRHIHWLSSSFYLVTEVKNDRIYVVDQHNGKYDWKLNSFKDGDWIVI